MNLEKEAGLREILKSLLRSTKDLTKVPSKVKGVHAGNVAEGLKGLKGLKNYKGVAADTAKGLVIPAAAAGAIGGSLYGYKYLKGREKTAAHTSKADDKNKKYPVSRALWGLTALNDLGITQAIGYRALRGRAAKGQKGLTPNEQYLLSHLNKNQEGKTYPISRFLTNPFTRGVLSGLNLSSIGYGLTNSPMKALGAGIAGAALGTGSAIIDRAIFARAVRGRLNSNNKGIFPSSKKVFDQLRSNNA